MNYQIIADHISNWLVENLKKSQQKGFVVGVSGGIDSAVTSTLSARTGLPTICLNIPIRQKTDQYSRSEEQLEWLKSRFSNVDTYTVDLTETFEALVKTLPQRGKTELALVNSRSRLRMITLYSFANSNNSLVVGTGNKIEDFGIGFFTKYGDGGVDVSPIGDLVKSEVYELAEYLDIPQSIQNAAPTDGLWEQDRTDKDQIGASYDELEWAMDFCLQKEITSPDRINNLNEISVRQREVLQNYLKRHVANRHKMNMPPLCEIAELR